MTPYIKRALKELIGELNSSRDVKKAILAAYLAEHIKQKTFLELLEEG